METYVDKYLSRVLGWALAKKGIGLEHPIRETQLKFKGESIIFYIKGDKALTLTKEEIDISSAREFAKKFREIKSSLSNED